MKVHFESHTCSSTLRWQTLELLSAHYTLPPGGYNEKVQTWRQRISDSYPGCQLHSPATLKHFRKGHISSVVLTSTTSEDESEVYLICLPSKMYILYIVYIFSFVLLLSSHYVTTAPNTI